MDFTPTGCPFFVRENGYEFCHNIETEYYSNSKLDDILYQEPSFELYCDLYRIQSEKELKRYLKGFTPIIPI